MFPLAAILILVFLIIFLYLIKQYRTLPTQNSRGKPIPGPRRLPIIGNLHQLLLGCGGPHRSLRELSVKHGPDLMSIKLGQLNLIIASSSESAKEILKTHGMVFADRPRFLSTTIVSYGNKDIAFAPYGAYWRDLRKICTFELLNSRRVKASHSVREEETMSLVKDIALQAEVGPKVLINLNHRLMMLSNQMTARMAFGGRCRHAELFVRAGKKVLEMGSGFNLVDLYPSLLRPINALTGYSSTIRRLHAEMDEIMQEIIEDHRMKRANKCTDDKEEEEEEDLVDVLLSLQEKGGLGFNLEDINIKAVIYDMYLGGTETAAITMEWAMAELMKHPNLMQKVQSEVRDFLKEKKNITHEDLGNLHYLNLVIKETLRLHPPTPLSLPRSNTESCTVMGYNVPLGSKVFINTWAIARDPKFWVDADKFMPERFDGCSIDFTGNCFDYLPFGGGRRVCPGLSFSMASMQLVLALLLMYFDWELPGNMKPEDLDMRESLGATLNRKSDLCLIAKPHRSSLLHLL